MPGLQRVTRTGLPRCFDGDNVKEPSEWRDAVDPLAWGQRVLQAICGKLHDWQLFAGLSLLAMAYLLAALRYRLQFKQCSLSSTQCHSCESEASSDASSFLFSIAQRALVRC